MKLIVAVCLATGLLQAQTNLAGFKELSIATTSSGDSSIRIRTNTLEAKNVTVKELIQLAYRLAPWNISGPAWIDEQGYDVHAVCPSEEFGTLRNHLQQALTANFGLASHMEKRMVDGYSLTVAPGGPKLAAAGTVPPPDKDSDAENSARLSGKQSSLAKVASELAQWIDKPVFDDTGLKGPFSIDVSWDMSSPDSLNAALRSQMGLQITPVQRQLDVMVVDRVEKPAIQSR